MLTCDAGAGSEQSAQWRGVEQPALRPPRPGSLLCLTRLSKWKLFLNILPVQSTLSGWWLKLHWLQWPKRWWFLLQCNVMLMLMVTGSFKFKRLSVQAGTSSLLVGHNHQPHLCYHHCNALLQSSSSLSESSHWSSPFVFPHPQHPPGAIHHHCHDDHNHNHDRHHHNCHHHHDIVPSASTRSCSANLLLPPALTPTLTWQRCQWWWLHWWLQQWQWCWGRWWWWWWLQLDLTLARDFATYTALHSNSQVLKEPSLTLMMMIWCLFDTWREMVNRRVLKYCQNFAILRS